NVTAPAAAGTYNFQWGMAQTGVGPFGSPSTNVPVTVSASGGGVNNAQFASQTVPASITAGGAATVTITMLNTGTTTWDAGYLLRSQNPAGSMTWGLIGSGVQSPVPPGSSATFTFNIQAPLTPGTYNFQWQMSQSTTGAYFGGMTPNVAIIVSSGSVDPLMITTTSLPFGQAFQAYSAQVTATGGEPAYSWSLSSGSLPAGLTLNPATGRVSGTPTVSGTFNIIVTVRDTGGRSASRSYKMFFR
ncbi:MAG: putative Ig domain-containing protein, partial [Blastocatellia bacterium]